MARELLKVKYWYWKQQYYGRCKHCMRIAVVLLAMLLYLVYNK